MNTVNETKTFSSLPEEESALWERMRDTLLCLQTDNSISVKDLAKQTGILYAGIPLSG